MLLYAGDEIADYTVVKLLNESAMSEIYLVSKSNKFFALKIAANKGRMTLFNEYCICSHCCRLQQKDDASHIATPSVYFYGDLPVESKQAQFFLVIEYMQCTLLQQKHLYLQNYPAILELCKKGLKGLQYLHKCGYVHGDVKPENIMGNKEQWKFIDFGLAQKIPRENRVVKGFSAGTPRYASIRVHEGNEPTCRDDVESWLYSILYLYLGTLPWQDELDREQVMEMKRISIPFFTAKLPDSRLCFLLQTTRMIGFHQLPLYDL